MSGLFTLTNSTMSWNSNVSPNAANFYTESAGSAGFASENGQNQIENLAFSTEPVGALFAQQDLINFLVLPSVSSLNISYIVPGLYTNAGCSLAVAAGDTCTPNVNGGVGFLNFVDNPGGATSTATWVFEGVEAGQPNTSWTATFTSQFNSPYQTVLASSSFSNSYAATVTVSSATPEPSSLIAVGIGLGLVTLWRAGANRKRKTL
jgi:hypothetical protein